jgi:hypothetical protein
MYESLRPQWCVFKLIDEKGNLALVRTTNLQSASRAERTVDGFNINTTHSHIAPCA